MRRIDPALKHADHVGQFIDMVCEFDPEGHVPVKVGTFYCQECEWPVMFLSRSHVWVAIRPFIIYEEPW